jgi:hypothetical protein
MNAQKERGSDSKNFGVTIAKIWWNEVIGTYLWFLELVRGISRIIFENLRASCKCVDCGLIVEKGRGLNEKWLEYLIFELFLIGNGHGPGP